MLAPSYGGEGGFAGSVLIVAPLVVAPEYGPQPMRLAARSLAFTSSLSPSAYGVYLKVVIGTWQARAATTAESEASHSVALAQLPSVCKSCTS